MKRLTFGVDGRRPEPDFDAAARDRSLNAAIVDADISASFEEYLDVLDRVYAEDFQADFDDSQDRIVGKDAASERLAGFLVPLHIAAEVCGLSVSVRVTPIESTSPEETRSAWTLDLVGGSGATSSLTWSTLRRWRGTQVVYEHYYDYRQVGDELPPRDLQPQIDHLMPWRFN
jgi:hypothetical protein